MNYQTPEPYDDIDLLFSRLDKVDPPTGLSARILKSLPAQQEKHLSTSIVPPVTPGQKKIPYQKPTRQRVILWRWIAALSILAGIVFSIRLGSQLDANGTFDLMSMLNDSDAKEFIPSQGDTLSLIRDTIPWFDLLAMLVSLITFWFALSSFFVHPVSQSQRNSDSIEAD
jgi:hypothetical protein